MRISDNANHVVLYGHPSTNARCKKVRFDSNRIPAVLLSVFVGLSLSACDEASSADHAQLQRLQSQIDALNQHHAKLEAEVETLKTDVEELQTKLSEVEDSAENAQGDVDEVKEEVNLIIRRM